jgi:RNA polymerase sigma factor (sigma-70 family)
MDAEQYEQELARRARAGDRQALAELVERARVRLFALAYAELRQYEDAQDAVAAATLQICRHIAGLREPERVRAWLQSIVRNEVRRIRRAPDAAWLSLEAAEEPANAGDMPLLRLDVEQALRRLNRDEAEALRLYYLDQLSTRDIAGQLGSPEGTVRSWLYRGRQHLAAEMKGYAPMTTTQASTPAPIEMSRTAALIHRDLDPGLVGQITKALRGAGYEMRIVIPDDSSYFPEALRGCQAVVLDEGREGYSALECLIHLQAHPDTREIPVNVLCADPPEFTVAAYFVAGVARLFRKGVPGETKRMARQLQQDGFWQQFTERARNIVFAAKEEAARRDHSYVRSEHLLLGLLGEPESVGCRVLTERLGLSLDAIRSATEAQSERGPGWREEADWLGPSGKAVLDLTFEEARRLGHTYIGTEHLLIGLLRERYGLAARVLIGLGVDLEAVRQEAPQIVT